MAKRIIHINCEEREDGGLRVWSDDLPGLILSHRDRVKVLSDIEPAVRALLRHKGESEDVQIDATFTSGERK